MIVLKSGELLRGKLIDKNNRSYLFLVESADETIEIPLGKVSILEVVPTKGASPKGGVIFFSETRARERPKSFVPEKSAGQAATAPAIAGSGVAAFTSKLNVLKTAKDTVAMSNARADETQQRLEEYKAIADATNS